MRVILIKLLMMFSLVGHSQQATITGNTQVVPGSQETYNASFTSWNWTLSSASWSVFGGTILWSDNGSCTVQWSYSNGTGSIYVNENWYGQDGYLQVQIGDPVPNIYPVYQNVYFGSTPSDITVYFDFTPSVPVSYQWQVWNAITNNWDDLTSQTNSTFQPPVVTDYKKYRCLTIVNGTVYNTLESEVVIPPFAPGQLYFSGAVSYNGAVTGLTSTNATGGYCNSNSYQYIWWHSVDGGPWQAVGTGANYPAGLAIIGQTSIKRTVSCNNETLSSNVINVKPDYLSPDWENHHFVKEITVLKKGIQTWQEADQLPVGEKLQTTAYFDGLGRTTQKINKEISLSSNGAWFDMVKHFDYTTFEARSYIPYPTNVSIGKFKPSAGTDQASFIAGYFGENAQAPTYDAIKTDESPLATPLKMLSAGTSWAGSNIGASAHYEFNTDLEKVHIWEVGYTAGALPSTTATSVYPTGKLQKTSSIDENGSTVITYTDFNGRVILKKVQDVAAQNNSLPLEHTGWTCTYYVYDDFGLLRYLITPKAVQWLDNNGWSLSQPIVDELCFVYNYDSRGRAVIRKKPATGEEYFVYDSKDRIVLSQHSNQRKINNPSLANDNWSFAIYDEWDRRIADGLVENNTTRPVLQAAVDQLTNGIQSISAFVGNSTYQTAYADNPVVGSSGSISYLAGNGTITFNSVTQFDEYGYQGVKGFNTSYTLSPAAGTAPEPTIKTDRTTGLVTGTKIRILDDDNNPSNDRFLHSTVYYDEYGRPLQTLIDNFKSGLDCQTNQYDFAGRLLSSFTSHSIGGGVNYTIALRNELDKLGRITSLYKNFNNSFFKQIASYSYNEYGQLKTKRLAPGYNGTQLETQDFSYNIQGALTGINKAYALSNNTYTQWDRFFSMYIGYDNRDNLFSQKQLNGAITGVIWRTRGDNMPRKFDYTYDYSGRLTSAQYKERQTPADVAWANNENNYSTNIDYEDGNGNIRYLKHMGMIPGTASPVVVDDLQYDYLDVAGVPGLKGNQLRRVADVGTLVANNGKLGDFKGGLSGGQDFFYDKAGNLIKDFNKDIQGTSGSAGIEYNYLNRPVKVTLQNKSVVEYTYDASGQKLSKRVTQANGGAAIVINYIGDFVYQEISGQNNLQYINHEEGRLKIITKINTPNVVLNAGTAGVDFTNDIKGVFEYFLKDHTGSTRMVLTEEIQYEIYRGTMEKGNAALEEPIFGKVTLNGQNPPTIPDDNELKATRFENTNPATSPWPGKQDDYVKLTASAPGKSIGPNLMLKVMAGDVISTTAKYYYQNNNPGGGTSNPVNTVVSSLINALLNPSLPNNLGKDFSSNVQTGLTVPNGAFDQWISSQPTNGATNAPKAYINIVFLDEQFRFVKPDPAGNTGVGTYSERVSASNSPSAVFSMLQQKAPKNGYVFVYLSNESNESVYFDDFYVKHDHDRISEESHYYPFGLKIAGISSRAFKKLEQKYGYQGEYSEEEGETGYNEFALRNYDPQIGRWTGADPYDQFASPYVGMGNNPVSGIDPDGGFRIDFGTASLAGRALATIGGSLLGYAADKFLFGGKGIAGAIVGGVVGLGATFIEPFDMNLSVDLSGIDNSEVGGALRDIVSHINLDDEPDEDGFRAFYKKDLIDYAKHKGVEPTEKNLGDLFEDIFWNYATNTLYPKAALALTRFRRGNRVWEAGTGRNTKPDFVADDFYDSAPFFAKAQLKRVVAGSAWEVKQNGGKGIYLSSNDGQIRGHIDNLAAMHAGDIATGDYNPMLTLITTYDVNYSVKTLMHATTNQVQYTHARSRYKIVNGQYQFKFVNVH